MDSMLEYLSETLPAASSPGATAPISDAAAGTVHDREGEEQLPAVAPEEHVGANGQHPLLDIDAALAEAMW